MQKSHQDLIFDDILHLARKNSAKNSVTKFLTVCVLIAKTWMAVKKKVETMCLVLDMIV